MGHRYGRSEMGQDAAWAGARAADSQWRADLPSCELDEVSEHDARVADDMLDVLSESVALVSGRWLDPDCRYLRHPAHLCHNREGEPLQPHQTCWLEARLQILEQSAVTRAAGLAVMVRS